MPTFRETYSGIWVNDEFKVSDKLTLTLGMRFDYQSARTETSDQYSTFDPNAPNPGAGNIPGALIFAGEGAGRAGTRKFEDVPKDAWGPRVGFAYRLGDKDAVRGGYGMYYAHVAFDQFVGQPTTGFQANAAATNVTNGIQPAFLLDQGFPAESIVRAALARPEPGKRHRRHRGHPGWADAAALPELVRHVPARAREQHDAGRVVHRQPRLPPEPPLGAHGRERQHERSERAGPRHSRVAGGHQFRPCARTAGIQKPYPTFTGNVAQALREFPQYQGIIWRGVPLGESQYHAFQTVLERRFSRGLQARVGYTFSRLKNNGAESAQGDNGDNGGVQNPADPLEWRYSARRRAARPARRVHMGGARARRRELAEGRARRLERRRPPPLRERPAARHHHEQRSRGLLFNTQKRPNRTSADPIAASGDFDPFTDSYFNRDAWTDPGPLQFGNAPQRDPDVRGFATYGEDINIFKVFPIGGAKSLRVRGAVRQYLQPHRLLRSEPELELAGVRHGQQPVQHASSRAISDSDSTSDG